MPPKAQNLQQAVDQTAGILGDADSTKVAIACAALSMLLTRASDAEDLSGIAAKLLRLISSEDPHVQKNSCAALTAALEVNSIVVREAVELRAVDQAASVLRTPDVDTGHAMNLCGIIGSLANSPEGLQSVLDSEQGLTTVLQLCDTGTHEQVAESALDVVCKIAATSSTREHLIQQGAVESLCRMLPFPADEVKVRVLLALGMMCGESRAAQTRLAEAPGALQSLVTLMRLTDDGDCRHVSSGLFALLANNPDVKDRLAGVLREQEESRYEGKAFTG